jgi:hypothetical protein
MPLQMATLGLMVAGKCLVAGFQMLNGGVTFVGQRRNKRANAGELGWENLERPKIMESDTDYPGHRRNGEKVSKLIECGVTGSREIPNLQQKVSTLIRTPVSEDIKEIESIECNVTGSRKFQDLRQKGSHWNEHHVSKI